jgi:hypothetical protein
MKRSEIDASSGCFSWCLPRFDSTKWASGAGWVRRYIPFWASTIQDQCKDKRGCRAVFFASSRAISCQQDQLSQGLWSHRWIFIGSSTRWLWSSMYVDEVGWRVRSSFTPTAAGKIHKGHCTTTTCTSRRFAVDYAPPLVGNGP